MVSENTSMLGNQNYIKAKNSVIIGELMNLEDDNTLLIGFDGKELVRKEITKEIADRFNTMTTEIKQSERNIVLEHVIDQVKELGGSLSQEEVIRICQSYIIK